MHVCRHTILPRDPPLTELCARPAQGDFVASKMCISSSRCVYPIVPSAGIVITHLTQVRRIWKFWRAASPQISLVLPVRRRSAATQEEEILGRPGAHTQPALGASPNPSIA